MAVITALEFDDQVAAGETARHADGGHGGFSAGIDQPHHFDGGHGAADGLGELHLPSGRGAKAGADLEGLFDGLQDGGVAMAEQEGTPTANVVDIAVAVRIPDVGALAAGDEGRGAADAAESAYGRIHAAGNGPLGAFEKSLRLGVVHRKVTISRRIRGSSA